MRPEPKRELSCLIGNLFATVEPPCAAEAVGEFTITGTTRSGKKATLVITGDAFAFYGDQEDIVAATERSCPNKHTCPLATKKGGGAYG